MGTYALAEANSLPSPKNIRLCLVLAGCSVSDPRRGLSMNVGQANHRNAKSAKKAVVVMPIERLPAGGEARICGHDQF